MTAITVTEVQERLADVISALAPGEEVEITDHDQPVARLTRVGAERRQPRQPGSAVGQLHIVTENEEHLRDFQEYMP
jgi:antitoxin (DNA-binding transcriptional repressor) of toxin-antitoxin stability system